MKKLSKNTVTRWHLRKNKNVLKVVKNNIIKVLKFIKVYCIKLQINKKTDL